MHICFYYPPTPLVQTAPAQTRVKISLPRIPSSELHGNHSLTPITIATGISITRPLKKKKKKDQFPLCVMCPPLYISLSLHLASLFCKMQIILCLGNKERNQTTDIIFVTVKSGCLGGELVDVACDTSAVAATTGKVPLTRILIL